MIRRATFRLGWLAVAAFALGIVAFRLDDRILTHWAYAVERGQIQANSEQLAGVQEVANAFRLVAKIARPGVVHIRVSGEIDPATLADLEQRLREQLGDMLDKEQLRELLRRHREAPAGTGSGIVLDTDGYVLTNDHVVSGRKAITVRLPDDREYDATLVGTDPQTDLAVVRIEARELHPLKFGDSDKLEVGDWVVAVGSPFGLSQTVTHGIVSAKGRAQVVSPAIRYQDFIQTDAAINPGNSGGPLLNIRGEVIGVNTAIATSGDARNAGIAFAIPSNMALKVAEQLKRHGQVARGYLGVTLSEVTDPDVELFRLGKKRGVLVNLVYAGSPADQAGLVCEDIILTVNGTEVSEVRRMQALIADVAPGAAAALRVWRDGKEQTLEVRVGRLPENIDRAMTRSRAIVGRDIQPLGIAGRALRADLRSALVAGLRNGDLLRAVVEYSDDRGIFVVARLDGTSATQSQLEPGELIVACNDEPVASVTQLVAALRAMPARRPVKLQVLNRAGERRIVHVARD